MYHHLCSCRCRSVHWDGVQDGPKLQVQVPEAVCSREVCFFFFLKVSECVYVDSILVKKRWLLRSFTRSMNTFLIIYLAILLFEAILSTILKYAWQAEDKWDEPFYNQKTEQERNSSPVSGINLTRVFRVFFCSSFGLVLVFSVSLASLCLGNNIKESCFFMTLCILNASSFNGLK